MLEHYDAICYTAHIMVHVQGKDIYIVVHVYGVSISNCSVRTLNAKSVSTTCIWFSQYCHQDVYHANFLALNFAMCLQNCKVVSYHNE